MTTTAFSFKQRFFRLYRSVLKQHLGLIALLTAITFLSFPVLSAVEMHQLVTGAASYRMYGMAEIYGTSSMWTLTLYVLLVPFLTVALLCQPLHNKRAADMYHSIPLSRRGLLGVWITAGMTIMAIPLLVGYAGIYLAALMTRYQINHPSLILWDVFLCLLTLFCVMSLVTLCAVCTGTAFDCIVFSILTMALPTAVTSSLTSLLREFSNGYRPNLGGIFGRFPFAVNGWFSHINWFEGRTEAEGGVWAGVPNILAWIVISCILTAVSFWYIRRRKNEMPGSLVRNRYLESVICLLITLSGGLAIGMSFGNAICGPYVLEKPQWIWTVFFTAIGGALIFAVTQTVFKRGLSLKKLLAYGGTAMAAMAAVSAGLLFYCEVIVEDYVPDASKVEQVSFNDDMGVYNGLSQLSAARQYWDRSVRSGVLTEDIHPVFTSEEGIRQVCGIHSLIIDDFNQISTKGYVDEEKYNYYLTFFDLTYHLKNGGTIQRNYDFRNCGLAAAVLERLCASEEYIRQAIPLFSPAYEPYIQRISLWDGLTLREEPLISLKQDGEKYRRLIEALSEEFIAMDPYVYYNETQSPVAWISYSYPAQESYQPGDIVDCSGSVPIYASFEKTVGLLEEYGYGDLLKPDFSTVEQAVLTDSSRFASYEGVLGKHFISFHNYYSISEVRDWIEYALESRESLPDPDKQGKQASYTIEREKEPAPQIEEVSQQRLLELVPQMRFSIEAKEENQQVLILCTEDSYVVRFLDASL